MVTEAMLTLLAAKVLAAQAVPRPQQTNIISVPVSCVALNKRDIRSKRFHAFVCVDALLSGDVTGAVLRKNGDVVCDIDGVFDGDCVTLVGCGLSGTSCF
jgi:hypothetical protein